MTYSVRCRSCRHRRVTNIHPDHYIRVPACLSCGKKSGWRIENRDYNKRNLCHCNGPVGQESGYNYPHKTSHKFCEKHPEGIYNQAKRQGVADSDIPHEYLPERLKLKQQVNQAVEHSRMFLEVQEYIKE